MTPGPDDRMTEQLRGPRMNALELADLESEYELITEVEATDRGLPASADYRRDTVGTIHAFVIAAKVRWTLGTSPFGANVPGGGDIGFFSPLRDAELRSEAERAREELGVAVDVEPTGEPDLRAPSPARELRELTKGALGSQVRNVESAAGAMIDAARFAENLEHAVAELLATARPSSIDDGDRFLVDVGPIVALRALVPGWTADDCVLIKLVHATGSLSAQSPDFMGIPSAERRLWDRVRRGLRPGDVAQLPRALGERLQTIYAGVIQREED